MSLLEDCPACGAPATRSHPALTAPFIAAYVLERPVEPCRLMICDDCGLWFFDRRYSDAEMAKLYGNYRGDGYFEARHRFEPWYTRAFNDHLGRHPPEIAARNAATLAFLDKSATGKPSPRSWTMAVTAASSYRPNWSGKNSSMNCRTRLASRA